VKFTEATMNFELSKEDLDYLKLLLEREYTSTLVEMHHTKHNDYRNVVKAKEKQIEELLARLKSVH
jgi:hypothetical protein